MKQRLSHVLYYILASILWTKAFYCHADFPATSASSTIAIAVNDDILPDYTTFVAKRDVASIRHYSGKGARRDVIELVLLQQALLLGGFKQPLVFEEGRSYLRTLRDIADGHFMTSANLAWKADIISLSDELYISHTMIHQGEFIVGAYTSVHNAKALAARSLADLIALTAVTSSQWMTDVRTLKELGFNQIIYSPNWVNMVHMIEAGRADVTLAPFQQTPGMVIDASGVKLVPIKGIKIAITGSRHWPVSRKHPQGKEFFDALERGLAELDAAGTIQRAYRECGFFHPDVADWLLLNNPASP